MKPKRALPLQHWGLERWPFGGVPAADRFYPTAAINEALARIEYLVESRRRLGMLLGQPGVGKSFALQVSARQLAKHGRAVVLVDATAISTRELFWQIAGALGAAPREDADVAQLWRHISDRVVENRLQQIDTVLLVDDAGEGGPDVLTQLVRLSRLDPAPSARWTMVLAAEPAQAAHWNETLRDLVDLRIDVHRWEQEDTVGYVQTALVDAGRFEPLFEESALRALHELADGVPRRVARLADYALLAGAAAEQSTIDVATVEAAHEEISWSAPAVAF
jgi:type II secretory pathway predicted ATPase ExeA